MAMLEAVYLKRNTPFVYDNRRPQVSMAGFPHGTLWVAHVDHEVWRNRGTAAKGQWVRLATTVLNLTFLP